MHGAAVGRDGVLILSIVAARLHMLGVLERCAKAPRRRNPPRRHSSPADYSAFILESTTRCLILCNLQAGLAAASESIHDRM